MLPDSRSCPFMMYIHCSSHHLICVIKTTSIQVKPRAERYKLASKIQRQKEAEEIANLASYLPFPEDVTNLLDKGSIMRLAIGYIRLKHILQKEMGSLPGMKEIMKKTGCSFKENEGQIMLDIMNGFLIYISKKGRILYVSEGVEKHLGLPQAIMIGKPIKEFIHPNDHKELAAQFNIKLHNQMNGVQPDRTVLPLLDCRNGTKVHISSETELGYYKLERQFQMRMKHYVSRRNNKLRQAGYKFLHLTGRLKVHTSTSPSGYSIRGLVCVGQPLQPNSIVEINMGGNMFTSRHDLDLRFTFCDARILALAGYDPSELIGKTAYQFHNPLDAGKVGDCHTNLILKGTCISKYYRFLSKNGTWVWLQTRAAMIYSASKQPQYITCMNYVISEEEAKREILKENQLQNTSSLQPMTSALTPVSSNCGGVETHEQALSWVSNEINGYSPKPKVGANTTDNMDGIMHDVFLADVSNVVTTLFADMTEQSSYDDNRSPLHSMVGSGSGDQDGRKAVYDLLEELDSCTDMINSDIANSDNLADNCYATETAFETTPKKTSIQQSSFLQSLLTDSSDNFPNLQEESMDAPSFSSRSSSTLNASNLSSSNSKTVPPLTNPSSSSLNSIDNLDFEDDSKLESFINELITDSENLLQTDSTSKSNIPFLSGNADLPVGDFFPSEHMNSELDMSDIDELAHYCNSLNETQPQESSIAELMDTTLPEDVPDLAANLNCGIADSSFKETPTSCVERSLPQNGLAMSMNDMLSKISDVSDTQNGIVSKQLNNGEIDSFSDNETLSDLGKADCENTGTTTSGKNFITLNEKNTSACLGKLNNGDSEQHRSVQSNVSAGNMKSGSVRPTSNFRYVGLSSRGKTNFKQNGHHHHMHSSLDTKLTSIISNDNIQLVGIYIPGKHLLKKNGNYENQSNEKFVIPDTTTIIKSVRLGNHGKTKESKSLLQNNPIALESHSAAANQRKNSSKSSDTNSPDSQMSDDCINDVGSRKNMSELEKHLRGIISSSTKCGEKSEAVNEKISLLNMHDFQKPGNSFLQKLLTGEMSTDVYQEVDRHLCAQEKTNNKAS